MSRVVGRRACWYTSINTSYIMPVMSLLYVYSCVGNQGFGKSGKVVDIERWEGESYVSFITNLSNTHYLRFWPGCITVNNPVHDPAQSFGNVFTV